MLVDGVHFSDRTTAPEDAGWRAATANLSDLAAMGASPIAITVGLGLRGDTPVDWVERLYQGMTNCLEQYQTQIVGGDVVRSPINTISITAIGQVQPDRVIHRGVAQPGDEIVVTGAHGAARAGLELLLDPNIGQHLSASDRQFLIQAHQRPVPRLDILPILTEILATDAPYQIAGMDSSDGLADAISQIAISSGVGAKIDRQLIPIPTALNLFTSAEVSLNYVLYGGEDFELVLCLPSEKAQLLVQKLGKGAAIIGHITKCPDIFLVDSQSTDQKQMINLKLGFQHF